MQVTLLHGYPDLVGRRRIYTAFGVGPTSYVQYVSSPAAGGDTLTGLPFQTYIDSLQACFSTDGTIFAMPIPSGVGPRQTWKFRYFNVSASTPGIGAEVTASTNLSTKSFQFFFVGGQY
jgi:hypothetical protein